MAIESKRWTRDDLERFPDDGNRYEVLDGELLVTPQAAPDHQIVAMRLSAALFTYCEANRIGATVGPAAVIFGKNELQPDIEVIPGTRFPRTSKWQDHPYPILVVEVLSSRARDRIRDLDLKRHAYLRLDISEYWVVDPGERCVHVFTKRHGEETENIVTGTVRWLPKAGIEPFEIALDHLFRVAI